MPITDKQREWRKKHLGASDAAALFGKDPFRSATDVYYSKVLDVDGDDAGQAAQIGNALEGAVLDWYTQLTGASIIRNQSRVAEDGIISASHDALHKREPIGVEGKTSGILFMAPDRDEWGEPGTDQVPDRVVIQCQQQMYVSELDRVDVPALLSGRGFVLFSVMRDDELIEIIRERGLRFWEENVAKRIPPTDEPPPLPLLHKLKRVPNKVVPLDDGLVMSWQGVAHRLSEMKSAKDAQDAAILHALGDAEAGECSLGTVTAYEISRRGYTVAPTKYRQLRFRESKSDGKDANGRVGPAPE